MLKFKSVEKVTEKAVEKARDLPTVEAMKHVHPARSMGKFIPNAVSKRFGRQLLVASKHSPTILFASGVVGVVATTVMACRATLKLEEVLVETGENFDKAKMLLASDHADYSVKDYQKDTAVLYIRGAVAVTKLYTPSILLGMASIGALAGSHNILNKRNASLTVAYAAVEKGFSQYRERVVHELGEDKDREFRYGTEDHTVVVDDKKKGDGIQKDQSGQTSWCAWRIDLRPFLR